MGFVADNFERMKEEGEEGSWAATELALLLELHSLPHKNRERTTRDIIGDRLVDRGLADEEADEIVKNCITELGQLCNAADNWVANIVCVLTHSEEDRIISPLLEAIPSMVTAPVLRQSAAANALNMIGNLLRHPRNARFRKPFVALLDSIEKQATDRHLCEMISDQLEYYRPKKQR